MNKKGMMWSNAAAIILITIALFLLILLVYSLRDRIKDYLDVLLEFLRI